MKLTDEEIEDFSDLDWSGSEWLVNRDNQSYYILINAGGTEDDKRPEVRKQILENQKIVERLKYSCDKGIPTQAYFQKKNYSYADVKSILQSILGDKE